MGPGPDLGLSPDVGSGLGPVLGPGPSLGPGPNLGPGSDPCLGPSSGLSPLSVFPGKEAGAGAVDEDDFIKAFEDVPSVQVPGPGLLILSLPPLHHLEFLCLGSWKQFMTGNLVQNVLEQNP